ncbi:hypothetical protein HispidOSU_018717 [Sigmodon hispidus]
MLNSERIQVTPQLERGHTALAATHRVTASPGPFKMTSKAGGTRKRAPVPSQAQLGAFLPSFSPRSGKPPGPVLVRPSLTCTCSELRRTQQPRPRLRRKRQLGTGWSPAPGRMQGGVKSAAQERRGYKHSDGTEDGSLHLH